MKMKLICNYWLMIIAWCMFLNDFTLLATVLVIGACVMLIVMRRRINYWRFGFVSIVIYCVICFVLYKRNIPLYFPNIYLFLAAVSLNASLTFERINLFKSRSLRPILTIMFIMFSVLSLISVILPNDLYTLFTKTSLIVMICLIFLPYFVPLIICLVYKYVRDAFRHQHAYRFFESRQY